MKDKFLPALCTAILIVLLAAGVLATTRAEAQPKPGGLSDTNPQKLLIPRWFLRVLILDGQPAAIPADQQSITIQFAADGSLSGTGGCNQFGGSYQAALVGTLTFTPLVSTQMACADGMPLEAAYFNALAKVQHFKIESGRLILSSADAQTTLTFAKPPK